ncbi:MAG: MFS transporter, partial [Campylobacteraceae bacterium]
MTKSNLKNNQWVILAVLMVAFTPMVLALTVLHIAIPSLTLDLRATGTEVLWIIDIYPFIMASLLIPMGTLADRVGHKKLLLIGLFIFLISSVLASISTTALFLIFSRGVMAFASAMIMPCILAIVRQVFEDSKERAMALGIWSAVGSAGAALGPLIGGFLLEHFWWGSVFLINIPIMLFAIPFVFIYISYKPITSKSNWTIGQTLILILALMSIVYSIKSGLKPDSSTLQAIFLALFGILLMFWFVKIQLNSKQPMLDVSLFLKPAITTGVIMALVVMGALGGVELTIAQELQFVVGFTPLQAGLFMLPIMISSVFGGLTTSFFLNKIGLRLLASLTLLIASLSLYGLSMSDFHTVNIQIVLLLVALGLSLSIGLTASSVAIMGSTPVEKAGSAGALEATSYDLGSGLGITIFGLVLVKTYNSHISLSDSLSSKIGESATHSIGETFIDAKDL